MPERPKLASYAEKYETKQSVPTTLVTGISSNSSKPRNSSTTPGNKRKDVKDSKEESKNKLSSLSSANDGKMIQYINLDDIPDGLVTKLSPKNGNSSPRSNFSEDSENDIQSSQKPYKALARPSATSTIPYLEEKYRLDAMKISSGPNSPRQSISDRNAQKASQSNWQYQNGHHHDGNNSNHDDYSSGSDEEDQRKGKESGYTINQSKQVSLSYQSQAQGAPIMDLPPLPAEVGSISPITKRSSSTSKHMNTNMNANTNMMKTNQTSKSITTDKGKDASYNNMSAISRLGKDSSNQVLKNSLYPSEQSIPSAVYDTYDNNHVTYNTTYYNTKQQSNKMDVPVLPYEANCSYNSSSNSHISIPIQSIQSSTDPEREKEKLFFSKEPRKVEYKPYSLEQYRLIKPKEYVEISNIKPDLNTDELVAKRANLLRVKEFARNLKKYNDSTLITQLKLPASSEQQQIQISNQKLSSKRAKALEFAKNIPKPKVNDNTDKIDNEKRYDTDKTDVYGISNEEANKLVELEFKHLEKKKQIESIKKSLGLK